MIITPFASFLRPANTTAYTAGDLIANSTVAGEVTPLKFGVGKLSRGQGCIKAIRLFKSTATVTNANFTLHLFTSAPTVTNGDNGALAVDTAERYLGGIACDMTSGAFVATGVNVLKNFTASPDIRFDAEHDADYGRVLYGLLEANAAYVPGSGETFKAWLEIEDQQG